VNLVSNAVFGGLRATGECVVGIFSKAYRKCCKNRFKLIYGNTLENYERVLSLGGRILAALVTGGMSELKTLIGCLKTILTDILGVSLSKKISCLLAAPDEHFRQLIYLVNPSTDDLFAGLFRLVEPSRTELTMAMVKHIASLAEKRPEMRANGWIALGANIASLSGIDFSAMVPATQLTSDGSNLLSVKESIGQVLGAVPVLGPIVGGFARVIGAFQAPKWSHAIVSERQLRVLHRSASNQTFDPSFLPQALLSLAAVDLGDYFCQALAFWKTKLKKHDVFLIGGKEFVHQCNVWKELFASMYNVFEEIRTLSWKPITASCDDLQYD